MDADEMMIPMLWIATLTLGIATLVTALIAAYYWYKSSVVPLQEFDEPVASVGDDPSIHILNANVNIIGVRLVS